MTRAHSFHFLILILTLPVFLGGCVALGPVRAVDSSTSSLYVAPTRQPQSSPTVSVAPTSAAEAQPENCQNVLSYVKDLTLPDGTFVQANSQLDKQWLVRNSGTCNWIDGYTLQRIDGNDLGAVSPQALVPARGGTEATVRILFTAPDQPGNYSSTWQAFNANGDPFGDPLTIVINVPD
jgi:hypothetical protein